MSIYNKCHTLSNLTFDFFKISLSFFSFFNPRCTMHGSIKMFCFCLFLNIFSKSFFHRCFSKIRNYNFILFQAQQFVVKLKANYSLSSVNVKMQLFQIFKELTERRWFTEIITQNITKFWDEFSKLFQYSAISILYPTRRTQRYIQQ